MTLIATDKHSIVVGLGLTGMSCVRFLRSKGHVVSVVDSRMTPPGIDELRRDYPDVAVTLGEFDEDVLCQADMLVVSPGVALSTPAIAAARKAGVPVRGDIDLFHEAVSAPVIAITGSNGKSTVTSLLGEMARTAGKQVAVGGNIGIPALDLIAPDIELYIVELSSFQLETTSHLNALAATVLNLSDDHMDRYTDRLAYLQAKQRIFQGARYVIVNDDDLLSAPLLREGVECIHFGLDKPDLKKFSSMTDNGHTGLFYGFDKLIDASELKIRGRHNMANALAALALGSVAGLPMTAMLEALRTYSGLPHRCQWLGEVRGVTFVNDSKGTNVGASAAAIESFGNHLDGKIVLIAGGVGKGADFSPLQPVLAQYARGAVLFGQDAGQIAEAVSGTPVSFADDLSGALSLAIAMAEAGDIVLFSPACASFDMFKNFEARGDAFIKLVEAL